MRIEQSNNKQFEKVPINEIERALLIGKAESLRLKNDPFLGLLISPAVTAVAWLILRDKQIVSQIASVVYGLSCLLTAITAFLGLRIEEKMKHLRIDKTITAYGLAGRYEKTIDSQDDYSRFEKADFSTLFRLKKIARVCAYSAFSTLSSIIVSMFFL